MQTIYDVLIAAIQQHWKSHENKYPQKILLSSAQHRQLLDTRKIGRIGIGSDEEPETDRFLGVPLEIDDSSPAALVAVNGITVALGN